MRTLVTFIEGSYEACLGRKVEVSEEIYDDERL